MYEVKLMEKITLYHGSNIIVQKPQIITNGFYKDFGYGFYCTFLEKQAKRWALTKKGKSILNIYSYSPTNELKKICFNEADYEWLDFIADCRSGIPHSYDIVEGPMADDVVWDYVEDYLSNKNHC